MATAAVVSAAATQVANLLTQEAKFLAGVDDEVKQLQTELRWMQSFLKEADKRQAGDERVRTWILEIRDLAYDVEDVIEAFVLKVAPRRRAGCANAVKRATCIFKEAYELHKIKSRIEKITKGINGSTRRVQTYGVRQLGGDDQSASAASSSQEIRRWEQRRSYSHLPQENVVGLDDQIEKLVTVLLAEGEESPAVSIFGMGGIGKTTLAKKVYNNRDQLKGRFDHFAWVYVSQKFEAKNVWAGILSSLDPASELKGTDPQVFAKKLYNFLQHRRCLVVLDDVWSAEDWDSLIPGFPIQGHAGKVLVTSRSRDVALHIHPRVYVHEMKCLNDAESWELFRKISLPRRHSEDLGKLEELGKEIVECCKGLPLAISVIGGVLATKNYTYHDWKMVHDNVRSYFKKAKGFTVHDSLSLSYEDLPSHLKPCFLYVGHFPEDFEIPVQQLIQMWVAEGFISATVEARGVMEDIAESYLIELIERCMIQVGKRHATMRIETCRIHDLMRDFCLSKADEEGFLYVIDHSHDNQGHMNILKTDPSRKCRIAIHKSGVSSGLMGSPRLRALMYFEAPLLDSPKDLPKGSLIAQKIKTYFVGYGGSKSAMMYRLYWMLVSWNMQQCFSHIFNSFPKLRVLQISSEDDFILFSNALKNVGSLMHLRYFRIAGFNVIKFPSSLGKLSCLLTLDLRATSDGVPIIPDVIWRMEQLRHLYFPIWFHCKSKLRLHGLRNLLTLVNFSTVYCHLGDIPFLTNLRELSMRGLTFKYEGNCKQCIAGSCLIPVIEEEDCNIGIEEDPMSMLGELPNLRILVIDAAGFSVKEMICSAGSFPQLESLTLQWLYNLEELQIAEGAMTVLYHLNISYCQKLKMLPTGFRYTKTLEKVEIKGMRDDFDNWWVCE